jgi:hypothetical protein
MDSLIPEEFVGRCVASADMMCATTTIYPDASVVRGGVTLTADELRRKYARQVDEYNALQKKRVREQKITEAKKSPISRLLRRFKKWCGSPVVEI